MGCRLLSCLGCSRDLAGSPDLRPTRPPHADYYVNFYFNIAVGHCRSIFPALLAEAPRRKVHSLLWNSDTYPITDIGSSTCSWDIWLRAHKGHSPRTPALHLCARFLLARARLLYTSALASCLQRLFHPCRTNARARGVSSMAWARCNQCVRV